MYNSRAIAAGASLATLVLACQAATAQTDSRQTVDASDELVQIEEVVVTARKRAEGVQDVPISITALSGRDLEERGVTTLDQLDRFAPGLTFQPGARTGGGGSTATVFIRGIGQIDYNPLTDQGVGLYVDGVFLGRATGQVMDVVDLDHIEVLRGPQGTLFGKNTIGGAVSIFSALPTGATRGYAELAAGSYNQFDQRFGFELPLTENLAAKISLSNRQRDGYGKSGITGEEFGDVDSQSGRLITRWSSPESATSFVLIADGTRQRQAAQFNRLVGTVSTAPGTVPAIYNAVVAQPPFGAFNSLWVPASDFTNFAAESRLNFNNLDVFGISGTLEWEVAPALSVTSISAFRRLDAEVGIDTDSAPQRIQELEGYTDQEQWSQELRLAGSGFGDDLKWLVGAYYFTEEISELSRNRIAPEVPIINTDQNMNPETETWALFTQLTYELLDDLSVTAGLRYSEEIKDLDASSIRVATMTPLIPVGTKRHAQWQSWTPKFSVEYHPGEDSLLYISYAEGFKSGGFNYQVINGVQDLQSYDPETATTYEAGFKTDWFGNRLRINGDVFYSKYDDLQFRATFSGGTGTCPATVNFCSLVYNAAEVTVTGSELEITARLTRGLDVFAGVAYIDDEFKQVDARLRPTFSERSQLPKTPTWAANVGAQYEIPIAFGSLVLRADYAYKTSMFTDFENSPQIEQDDFGLLNVRAALRSADERWELDVSGQNVTDETYITSGFRSAFVGIAVASYGVPATWTASLRYRFGE